MHFRMSGTTGSQILTARAAFGDAADKVKDPSLHLKYGYVQDDASENLMELSFKLRLFQTSAPAPARSLRLHPGIRPRQLNRNVRNKNVQRLAVGGAAMLG